jgi:drug/metabolite transporter (DMT)-like permease
MVQTTSSTTAIPPRVLALLLVLTLVWGTNWPLFRYATAEVSVWTFRAISMWLAGVVLLLVAHWKGHSLTIERRQWPALGLATLCYLLLWNVCSTYAAIMIPSGQAAILGFTMPLWTALITSVLLQEKIAPRVWAAVALGAVGVGLLMWRGLDAYAQAPLGFAMGLAAGLGWAVGTVVLKRSGLVANAIVLTGWQLVLCAGPMTLAAFALGDHQWFMPSWRSILVITYIGLVPMCIGNLCWFSIVGALPASVAGVSTILVPMVAMVSGAIVHQEPLGAVQLVSMLASGMALFLVLSKR